MTGSLCQILPSSTLQCADSMHWNCVQMEGVEEPAMLKTARKKPKKGSSPADEEFNLLLSSEIRLASLRKAMKLHDRTVPFDAFVSSASEDIRPRDDEELKSLEGLTKRLPGYIQPDLEPCDSVCISDLVGFVRKNDAIINKEADIQASLSGIDIHTVAMEKKVNEGAHNNEAYSTIQDKELCERRDPRPAARNDNCNHVKCKPSFSASIKLPDIAHSSKESFLKELTKTSSEKLPSEHGKMTNKTEPTDISQPFLLESSYDRVVQEGLEASLAANLLLDSFRRNRRTYWANKFNNANALTCVWCSVSNNATTRDMNDSNDEFGVIKDDISFKKYSCASHMSWGATGDALIQCMECGFVGCGPRFLDERGCGSQHAMLHFLMSGHKFGEC